MPYLKNYTEQDAGTRATFDIVGADIAISNSLRRVMMQEIPVWGIEVEDITANTTSENNEFIGNRVEMIPIMNETFTSRKPIDNLDNLKFTITFPRGSSSNNDHSASDAITGLYAKDIVFSSGANATYIYKDYQDIIILYMYNTEKMKVNAKIVNGVGDKNAKWNTSVCSYEIVKDDICRFFVEYVGILTPLTTLIRALEVIISRYENLKEAIDKQNTQKIVVNIILEQNDVGNPLFDIVIYDEDTTLGQPLKIEMAKHLQFCGGSIDYPLDKNFRMRASVKSPLEKGRQKSKHSEGDEKELKAEMNEILKQNINRVIKVFGDILKEANSV